MNKRERTRNVVTRKGGPGGRGAGRPPMFVVHKGVLVQGLSYQRATDRFYATYPCVVTGNRRYFGYEIDQAVKEFRRWIRTQKKLA